MPKSIRSHCDGALHQFDAPAQGGSCHGTSPKCLSQKGIRDGTELATMFLVPRAFARLINRVLKALP